MTVKERDELIKKIFDKCRVILLKKGHDYSGEEDCLSNLRDFGFLGVVVRLGDKYNRLKNFVKQRTLQVKDESVVDTLLDTINYAFLAIIFYCIENGVEIPALTEKEKQLLQDNLKYKEEKTVIDY